MRKRLSGGVLLLAACIGLAGCNSNAGGPDLDTPSTTTSASTSTSSQTATPTVSAEEQAVLDAYTAFYAAVDEAQADPRSSQTYLEPVATGVQFETTNGSIKADILDGIENYGSPVLQPEVESIDGDTAVVHDCQDTSTVGSRKIDSGEVLTVGTNPSSAKTTLSLVEGTWKVSATEFVEPAGAYCA